MKKRYRIIEKILLDKKEKPIKKVYFIEKDFNDFFAFLGGCTGWGTMHPYGDITYYDNLKDAQYHFDILTGNKRTSKERIVRKS